MNTGNSSPDFSEQPKKSRIKLIDSTELVNREFPDIPFLVEGLLMVGLTIVAGPPKRGKSYLMLHLAWAVATGTPFLGSFATEKAKVLYASLEDTDRRLNSRMRMMGVAGTSNFYLTLALPKGRNEAAEALRELLADDPGFKLIIIDTLTLVRRENEYGEGYSSYGSDYSFVREFKQVADEFSIAIVFVTHTRKNRPGPDGDIFESIIGTNGVMGAADAAWILARTTGSNNGRLVGTGRDAPEFDYAVRFDPGTGTWQYAGNAKDVGLHESHLKIKEAIAKSEKGELLPGKIAQVMQTEPESVRKLVRVMLNKGELVQEKFKGPYSLPQLGNDGHKVTSQIPPDLEKVTQVTDVSEMDFEESPGFEDLFGNDDPF